MAVRAVLMVEVAAGIDASPPLLHHAPSVLCGRVVQADPLALTGSRKGASKAGLNRPG
jgi:hypothetical protein